MNPRRQGRVDRRHRTPGGGWLVRLVRGRRLDRNPLRRRSDRTETVLLGVLLTAFLASAPFAAGAAGSSAHTSAAREAQAQRAVRYPVQATLLQSGPGLSPYAQEVNARWRAPDGQLRTGQVYMPDGAVAGRTVSIWVSRSGQQTDPPLQPSQIASRTELAGAAAAAVLAVVLTVVGGLTWRTLTSRRLAAWDADWQATEPRWSARRS